MLSFFLEPVQSFFLEDLWFLQIKVNYVKILILENMNI